MKKPQTNLSYYTQLSQGHKSLYDALSSGIMDIEPQIAIPYFPIGEVTLVFSYLLLDYPSIFYAKSFQLYKNTTEETGVFMPEYFYSKAQILDYRKQVSRYLTSFDKIKNQSDMQKEIYVHDFCLENFKYDFSKGKYAHCILGLVKSKTAVCEGIAKFVKLVLDYVGVPNLVVTGDATNPVANGRFERHAWNIVAIEGRTYHLDVTFDMTVMKKNNRHDYFNLHDDDISRDHILSKPLPACTTAGRDYYTIFGMSVSSLTEMKGYIKNILASGKKTIMIKLKATKLTESDTNAIIEFTQKEYMARYKTGVYVEVNYNPTQMVFEITCS
jgi:transglutaminase/protease-like cytokinesis protein 3